VSSAIALGRAYVKGNRSEHGLVMLRNLITQLPENLAAWDALLASLDESSHIEELALFLGQIPMSIAENQQFARHRGALAFRRRDWSTAADWYRRAWEFDPSDS